jgi:hypothetical protein
MPLFIEGNPMSQEQFASHPPSLSELELAIRWNKSTRTLLTYRKTGKLKGFKDGQSVRYLLSEIECIEQLKTVAQ